MFIMKIVRFARLITCIVVLLAAVQVQAQSKKQRKAIAAANTQIENNLKTFVGILASDSLEGRRTGTTGEAKAVAYIENYYKQLGIAGANNGSYLQPFVVDEGKTPNASQLQLDDHVLKAGVDFFPLPWSGLQNIDAESAAALQEIGSPWWYDLKEDLEANKNNPHLLPEQLIRDKATAAAKIGATALLVYNTAVGEEVIKYNAKDRSDAAAIPVFYIQKEAVHKYKIDTDASFHVKAKAVFTQQKRNGTNVAAFINNNAAQTIILGAHLDHLGYGEDANSRHTGDAAIHNGADDNASGTAALMEVARLLKEKPNQSFNYLLLHFSGEELGLYGSKFYTEHPLVDFKQVNYMINMDMVGRLNPESKVLTIGGIGTSPAWSSVLKMNEQTDFSIKIDSSGTGPSDHTSFYRKDLPVLFFFTGLHTDYHKPSDDAHLINYSGMRHIVQYISRIIDNTPVAEKLAFTKTKEQQMGGGRFKVSIGIMPDYTFSGQGVKADGIIDGRPAQKAGVQAGDVIIQLGEHLITSVETYMQALNRFDKGQQTTVTIKRGSEIKEFAISF